MLILLQPSTDPYFNIATEEYLLRNSSDSFFIIYRNEPSIIIGKHQNAIAEINLDFVKQKGLKVVRRLSGGGTVYHDSGNINYAFIANGSEGNLVDFKKFTQPIIDVLNSLSIDARIGGKNDIRVGDKKISGNAEHVYKNRVLHHGTLLFSSNLDELNESIKIDPKAYTDKAVKSIRSHVSNITEYLKNDLSIDSFTSLLVDYINQSIPDVKPFTLSEAEINAINDLVKSKYSTWDWNFGYSPSYTLNRRIEVDGKPISIELVVEKGIISQISITHNGKRLSFLEQLLIGNNHDYDSISKVIYKTDFEISKDNILRGLF